MYKSEGIVEDAEGIYPAMTILGKPELSDDEEDNEVPVVLEPLEAAHAGESNGIITPHQMKFVAHNL